MIEKKFDINSINPKSPSEIITKIKQVLKDDTLSVKEKEDLEDSLKGYKKQFGIE